MKRKEAPPPRRRLAHGEMVSLVARILAGTWRLRTEHQVCEPGYRERHYHCRFIDLSASCGSYKLGFEIKSSWKAYQAEVLYNPEKHRPQVQFVDEFYFVLLDEECGHLDNVPADAGMILVTRDNELRIVKPAPRRLAPG